MRTLRASLLLASVLMACGRTPIGTRVTDEPPTPTGSDAPIACSDLRGLAERGPLLSLHAKEAYFVRDRTHVVLRVKAGILDRLVRVDLPSGKTTTISTDQVYWAQPLGPNGNLLVDYRANDGNDPLYVYDGHSMRKLAQGLGWTAPSPDGQRIYAIGFDKNGSFLSALDAASGKSTVLVPSVDNGPLTLSPSGEWLAYDASGTIGLVRTDGGLRYTISSQPGAREPVFVTDDLLLFSVGDCRSSVCNVWGNHVGSDDSYLIAGGESYAPQGYQISADNTSILLSAPSWSTLTRYSVDGHDVNAVLSTTLFSDSALFSQMRLFAFESQRARAIYQTEGTPYSVTVSLSEGGPAIKLADHATFLPAPSTSSVILFETLADGYERLRLVGIDSGADRLTYTAAASIGPVTALRGDGALLFVEAAANGTSRLRFLSNGHPDSVVLGEWNTSLVELVYPPESRPRGSYPVDPTGCFTIVDSDLAPNAGTRLVLLPE